MYPTAVVYSILLCRSRRAAARGNKGWSICWYRRVENAAPLCLQYDSGSNFGKKKEKEKKKKKKKKRKKKRKKKKRKKKKRKKRRKRKKRKKKKKKGRRRKEEDTKFDV
jgi:hypothetical protein